MSQASSSSLSSIDLKSYLKERCEYIDQSLDRFLPSESTFPETIHKAMRYSIFAGGKRLRPILCLAAAEACGGSRDEAVAPACATEILHTYTLIHDDLPCMDDDDLRRGRPTSHKVYGEGIAVLAGDALLTEAFSVLAQASANERFGVAGYVTELAKASGSQQLIGGQVLDLESEGEENQIDLKRLEQIHHAKTAALLTSSIRLGAMTAAASNEQLEALTKYGENLGHAFQVIDDILDVTQSTEKLGKTAGKDENVDKATYPSILGLEESKKIAKELSEQALVSLSICDEMETSRLEDILHYLLDRDY